MSCSARAPRRPGSDSGSGRAASSSAGGSGLDGVDDVVQLVRHGAKVTAACGIGTKGVRRRNPERSLSVTLRGRLGWTKRNTPRCDEHLGSGDGPVEGARRRQLVALTPDEIEGREFRVVDQGYDMVQVDTFLTEVAASYRYAVHNLLPGASGVGPATGRHPAASSTDALSRVGQEVVGDPAVGARQIAETVRGEADSDAATVRGPRRPRGRRAAPRRPSATASRPSGSSPTPRSRPTRSSPRPRNRPAPWSNRPNEEATQRSEEMLGRSRRHAEQILRAERAVVERLHEVAHRRRQRHRSVGRERGASGPRPHQRRAGAPRRRAPAHHHGRRRCRHAGR